VGTDSLRNASLLCKARGRAGQHCTEIRIREEHTNGTSKQTLHARAAVPRRLCAHKRCRRSRHSSAAAPPLPLMAASVSAADIKTAGICATGRRHRARAGGRDARHPSGHHARTRRGGGARTSWIVEGTPKSGSGWRSASIAAANVSCDMGGPRRGDGSCLRIKYGSGRATSVGARRGNTRRGQSNQAIKSNQIKSNQIKSNQIKSNQIKSNQIKSNAIKSSNQINHAHVPGSGQRPKTKARGREQRAVVRRGRVETLHRALHGGAIQPGAARARVRDDTEPVEPHRSGAAAAHAARRTGKPAQRTSERTAGSAARPSHPPHQGHPPVRTRSPRVHKRCPHSRAACVTQAV
jgi:hypothetical protein